VTPPTNPSGKEQEVIDLDFDRYLAALRRYGWMIVAVVAVSITGAVFYTKQQVEIYEATASVQIEPRLPDLLGQGNDLVAIGAASGGSTVEYYRQQRQVLGSFQLIRLTVQNKGYHEVLLGEKERAGLSPADQYDLAARRLQHDLTIRYPEQNRIMYVSVRNATPRLAMDIANAHVETYVAYSKDLFSTDTSKVSTALNTEFTEAEKKLKEADAAMFEFQRQNDLLAVSLQDRQNLITAKITTYSQKFDDAHSRSRELLSRLERLRKVAANVESVDSPILAMADSTAFDALRAQYYAERNAFNELAKEYGPKTVEYGKAQSKVNDLRDALVSEARRVVGAAEEQYAAALRYEADMAAEVDKYTKMALGLGDKIVAYNDLARKKKTVEDSYNILVARLQASQLTGRLTKGVDTNVRPLDPARLPTTPVSPNLKINLMVATSLSLVLSIGLAILLVFLDRSVKTTEDAQTASAAPVLGIIPILATGDAGPDDKARDLYVHRHPTSRVAECCRSLRTNVVFSAADRELKTLVVSSANPREGKTTVVIYLGTTMAQSGQRVLIVDTDMRRPRLHASTGVPRGRGLSNLIVGDGAYDDVIKSTEIPNLFVLPCGPLPPNPAELLMTNRFQAVLEDLGRRFDRVILDSPPLGAVTDAVVLSRQTDGVLLVVRAGKTQRDEVKRSVRQIRDVNGQVIGVILNELDIERRRGYYYQYYGYGEKEPARAS
jgi:capsular exopolysaccharide synthesis family protein